MTDKQMYIAQIIKEEDYDSLREEVSNDEKDRYQNDFVAFMEKMLKKHKVSRKQVALRTGLSQDYLYKLLRKDKTTNERDYIIAICFGIGMNHVEANHALITYGMRPLIWNDIRDQVIIASLSASNKIEKLNDVLEKAGLPYLRTNPDMEKYEITNSDYDGEDISVEKIKMKLKEGKSDTYAVHYGNAPVDYYYWGQIEVFDQYNNRFVIQEACFEELHIVVMNDEDMKYNAEIEKSGNEDAEYHFLETYDSVLEAAKSNFFEYILKLDHLIDEKIAETLKFIDDTKNYKCRIGMRWGMKGFLPYIEAFNDVLPEKKEYYQIVTSDEGTVYSASHESYFLRIEMDGLYNCYFPAKEPEYFFKATSLDNICEHDSFTKRLFTDLEKYMYKYVEYRTKQSSLEDDCHYEEKPFDFEKYFQEEEINYRNDLKIIEDCKAEGISKENCIEMTAAYSRVISHCESRGRNTEALQYSYEAIALEKLIRDMEMDEHTRKMCYLYISAASGFMTRYFKELSI